MAKISSIPRLVRPQAIKKSTIPPLKTDQIKSDDIVIPHAKQNSLLFQKFNGVLDITTASKIHMFNPHFQYHQQLLQPDYIVKHSPEKRVSEAYVESDLKTPQYILYNIDENEEDDDSNCPNTIAVVNTTTGRYVYEDILDTNNTTNETTNSLGNDTSAVKNDNDKNNICTICNDNDCDIKLVHYHSDNDTASSIYSTNSHDDISTTFTHEDLEETLCSVSTHTLPATTERKFVEADDCTCVTTPLLNNRSVINTVTKIRDLDKQFWCNEERLYNIRTVLFLYDEEQAEHRVSVEDVEAQIRRLRLQRELERRRKAVVEAAL